MGVVTGRAGDPGGNRVDPNLSTSHMLVMVMVTILGTKAIIAVTALMVMVMMGGGDGVVVKDWGAYDEV